MERSFSKNDTNILKGLAIIFMLTFHCFMLEERFINYPMSTYPFDTQTFIWFARGGKCCVGIFVFLSAYGMACTFFRNSRELKFNKRQAEVLTARRLINLYSGYWFVYIFCFIVCCILSYVRVPYYYYTKDAQSILESITYMCMDLLGLGDAITGRTIMGSWWYMGFAVGLIVLFPLIMKMYRIGGFMLVILTGILLPVLKLPINNYTRFLMVVPLGIFCADKNLLARIKDYQLVRWKPVNSLLKMILITILTGFGMYDFANHYTKLNYETPIRDVAVVFLLILWGYLFWAEIPVIRIFLAVLGKYSMNIFLLHSFIRGSWLKDHIHSFPHFTLVVLVLILESLALSIVLELFKKYSGYTAKMKKFQKAVLEKMEA